MKRLLKPLFVLVLILITQQIIFAQDAEKTVEIIVSGSAKTQDEAKQLALRSAIEQAFGVFISSKTEILNDNLVSDQITSISNGNIKSYQVLNESQLPDGSWGVTLKSIVSIDKLTSFVQAKGVEVEIKGGLFALNIKQQLLNEQAEIKSVNEMVALLYEQMQISFDYSLKSGEPKSIDSESKNWEIPLVVSVTTNKNFDFCTNFCIKTLEALSLSSQEVVNYQSLNKNVFPIYFNNNGKEYIYYLRKEISINTINSFLNKWDFYSSLFFINNGIDDLREKGHLDRKHSIFGTRYENGIRKQKIDFPAIGVEVSSYSLQDKLTLSEIEKIKGYIVIPRGLISLQKHGGYVVYEENGHGLVVSTLDIGDENIHYGYMEWNAANLKCNELLLNDYNDWYLPSIEEFKLMYIKFGREFFNNSEYWTSNFDVNEFNKHYLFSFYTGSTKNHNGVAFVRAVRKF